MTQKLKALGLALIAAGAMSAMAAPAVQGHAAFTAEKVNALVEGITVEGLLSLATSHGTVNCTSTTFHGVTAALETTEQTLTAIYGGCKWAGLNAAVNLTDCEYLFTAKETEINADVISANAHIICPPEKKMHIKVVGSTCEATVGPQTIENGITFENRGGVGSARDIKATLNITGITYTVHNPLSCPNPGGSATVQRHNGTLTGKITITAHNEQGAVGLAVH